MGGRRIVGVSLALVVALATTAVGLEGQVTTDEPTVTVQGVEGTPEPGPRTVPAPDGFGIPVGPDMSEPLLPSVPWQESEDSGGFHVPGWLLGGAIGAVAGAGIGYILKENGAECPSGGACVVIGAGLGAAFGVAVGLIVPKRRSGS